MSANRSGRWRPDVALVGGGLLIVLCCAVGLAVIGVVAGGVIGGWLGIACAIVLAAVAGVILYRRTRGRGGC